MSQSVNVYQRVNLLTAWKMAWAAKAGLATFSFDFKDIYVQDIKKCFTNHVLTWTIEPLFFQTTSCPSPCQQGAIELAKQALRWHSRSRVLPQWNHGSHVQRCQFVFRNASDTSGRPLPNSRRGWWGRVERGSPRRLPGPLWSPGIQSRWSCKASSEVTSNKKTIPWKPTQLAKIFKVSKNSCACYFLQLWPFPSYKSVITPFLEW